MYKVFFKDRVVFIGDEKDLPENIANSTLYKYDDQLDLLALITEFSSDQSLKAICLSGKSTELLWRDFKACFQVVDAAGGLVRNDKDELLAIYRQGRWDLPKGHVENNESFDVAAMREVSEECGIGDLQINKKLPETYHTYMLHGELVLKETHWYTMRYKGKKTPKPQLEESITDVVWLSVCDVEEKAMVNTYCSLMDMWQRFIDNDL